MSICVTIFSLSFYIQTSEVVPKFLHCINKYAWRVWYFFSCEHDVIGKGNTERQRFACCYYSTICSTHSLQDIVLPLLFLPFWVFTDMPMSNKVFLPHFYPICCLREKILQALDPHLVSRDQTGLATRDYSPLQCYVPEWRSLGTRLQWCYRMLAFGKSRINGYCMVFSS